MLLRGGKLKGQGTYGCVFQPALLCRGSTNDSKVDPKKVGKITLLQDGRNELEISEHLHTIEGYEEYTIPVELETCVPRARSRQEEKDLDKCEFIQGQPIEKTIQLTMPWGGIALPRINLSPTNTSRFKPFDSFEFMKDILAMGAFLVINDICHFDIYANNILIDAKNKPRFIDFGLGFRPSELTSVGVNARWRLISVAYNTETPEVTLMAGSQYNVPQMDLIRGMQLQKPAVQDLAAITGLLPSEWSDDLIKWTEESQSFQQQDWLTCWKLYWPGFDAWAIGATLLDILNIQLSFPSFRNSQEWKSKSTVIKTILRGMCRGNPIYRMDAVEALHLFTDGSHSLISAGSVGEEWVNAKKEQRRLL